MPDPAPGWRSAVQEFVRPLPLAAVALLAVNDHVLKSRWPGTVTGKLSDVAGCFFLPLFVSALLGGATRWRRPVRIAAGACATGVLFGAIKLSPSAADAVATVLTVLARPAGLPPSRIVADATDLAALPFVGLAAWRGLRAADRPERGGRLAFAGRLVGLSATLVLLTATSYAPSCPPESGLVQGPVTLWAETDCGPHGFVVLRVDPATCRATLDGGAAVGLGERGTAYWRQGHRVVMSWEGAPAVDVPEGRRPLSGCTLRGDGSDLLRVECTTGSYEERGMHRVHDASRCSGTLRRIVEPEWTTEVPGS